MLEQRELFKFGFLMRCAEEGLTKDQTDARVSHGMDKLADGVLSNIGSALTTAGMWGPIMAGGVGLAGGYGLGKITDQETDTEDIQQQEIAAMYKFQASESRRRAQSKRLRDAHRERIRTQQII